MKYARFIFTVFVIGLVGCESSEVNNPAVTKADSSATEISEAFEFNNPTFEAPIMLMAGDEPMKAGYSYPSPAVFDVDNDGDDEMVLGEIMGSVSYCENENKSGGDPVWSAVAPLLAADGKPLELNNW
jgi:hypothetical protein